MCNSGISEIVLAVIVSVTSGVVLNLLWEEIKMRLFEPKKQLQLMKSKILFILIEYANAFSNPFKAVYHYDDKTNQRKLIRNELHDRASEETRKTASELASLSANWIGYRPKYFSKENADSIMRDLIGLSNSVYYNDDENDTVRNNKHMICNIRKKLQYK